ncbi:hypothetical protein CsSME_00051458 [Camellia sinensis var. sinensis]
MTQNCRALKQHLEDLVAAGHLRDYIDQDKEVNELGNPPPEPNMEHPPRLIINRVMSMEPASKKVRTVPKSPLCTVSFTSKDLEGIQHPHTDALIITVGIEKRKLGLSEQHLTPAVAPLVGFNSQLEWLLGRIVLPVVAGTKTLQI